MATITRTYSPATGDTILAAHLNTDLDTIYNEFNGSINNANIDASAAIASSKVDLSSIDGAVTINDGKLLIDQDSDAAALDIDSEATTAANYGFRVVTGQGAIPARFAYDANCVAQFALPSTTTATFDFYRNYAAATTDGPVVRVYQDSATDDQDAVSIIQDCVGSGLKVAQNDTNGTGAVYITGSVNDANVLAGIQFNLANAGAGNEAAFKFSGSEVVNAAVGGAQDYKIRVKVGATDYFIPLHTA